MPEQMKVTPVWAMKLPKERRVRARAPVLAGDALTTERGGLHTYTN